MQRFQVSVTANAKVNKIVEILNSEPATRAFRVWVTTTPEHGKANQTVTNLLANFLHVAPSLLGIKRGHRGKNKLFELMNEKS